LVLKYYLNTEEGGVIGKYLNTRLSVFVATLKINDLGWPELTLNSYYALCCITHMTFGAHHKNLNEDRPLSATKM